MGIFFDLSFDGLGGVNHSGVISAAEFIANGGKRGFCVLAAQIHGHLPWQGDILRTALGFEIADLDIEIIADSFLDTLDGDFRFRTLEAVHQDFFGEIDGNQGLGK